MEDIPMKTIIAVRQINHDSISIKKINHSAEENTNSNAKLSSSFYFERQNISQDFFNVQFYTKRVLLKKFVRFKRKKLCSSKINYQMINACKEVYNHKTVDLRQNDWKNETRHGNLRDSSINPSVFVKFQFNSI